MSDLRKLAQFIHDITWDQLPERVRETAALRVLDLVSVAAGAAKDPLVAAAKQALGAVSGCPVEMPCDNSDACLPDTDLDRRLSDPGRLVLCGVSWEKRKRVPSGSGLWL